MTGSKCLLGLLHDAAAPVFCNIIAIHAGLNGIKRSMQPTRPALRKNTVCAAVILIVLRFLHQEPHCVKTASDCHGNHSFLLRILSSKGSPRYAVRITGDWNGNVQLSCKEVSICLNIMRMCCLAVSLMAKQRSAVRYWSRISLGIRYARLIRKCSILFLLHHLTMVSR